MEILIEYITYVLTAIGILAFFTSMITQVIKEMPGLKNISTKAVAFVVALILCPSSVVVVCQYYLIPIKWYYIFLSCLAAFVVYLVATGGWERVNQMWDKTRYNKE